MISKFLKVALFSSVLFATGAQAKEDVVWWDFLGGGDGVRMKQLISEFNKEMSGKVEIQATTLEWGVPFYAKVQTSAAVGEAPDVMTYHASRLPFAVQQGILQPITADDFKAMGMGEADFAKATWDAVTSRWQAILRAARYPPDRALLQQGHSRKSRTPGRCGKPTGLNGMQNSKPP